MHKIMNNESFKTTDLDIQIPGNSPDDMISSNYQHEFKRQRTNNVKIPGIYPDEKTLQQNEQSTNVEIPDCNSEDATVEMTCSIDKTIQRQPMLHETLKTPSWPEGQFSQASDPEHAPRLLWDINEREFSELSSTFNKMLLSAILHKEPELTQREEQFVSVVTNVLNRVTSIDEASQTVKDMFVHGVMNDNYTPIVFGGNGEICRVVTWRDEYQALVNLGENELTMILDTAGTIFCIKSEVIKPTQVQMFATITSYTGVDAVTGTLTSVRDAAQATKDAKSHIGELSDEVRQTIPQVKSTLSNVDKVATSINEAIPAIAQDIKSASDNFGTMTDDLRESVSSIVPSVIEAVKGFLGSAVTAGKYTVATLVLIGIFKLLHELFAKLSKVKQVMVLRIVGSGLLIAGLAATAYHIAGQHLLKLAESIQAGWKRAKTHWDDAKDDCYPEFKNLKRITDIMGKAKISTNSGIRVKLSEPMFRFKRELHAVRRILYDLYMNSGVTDKLRILFNAIFYVDSPGVAPKIHDELKEMVRKGASGQEVMKKLISHEDYFEIVAFNSIAEAKEVTEQQDCTSEEVKRICNQSANVTDKLLGISRTMHTRIFGMFASSEEKDMELSTLAPTESQGINRDGPNSVLAILLVIVRSIQNPATTFKQQYETLRKESNNMKVLTSAAECFWEALPNHLRVSAYEHYGLGAPNDVSKQVTELLCACHMLVGDVAKARKRTSELKQRYFMRYGELQKVLTEEKYYTKRETFTYALLRSAFEKMRDSAKLLDDVSDSNGHRVKTLCLWFEGMPGLGKSQIMDALAKRFAPDYPVDNRVHTWVLTEQFMSGYNAHWAVDVDDIGTNPELLSSSAFFQDFLTKGSDKRCTVNKAFEKGGLFTSHVIGMSSNSSLPDVLRQQQDRGTLNNPDAVLRRLSGRDGMRVILKPSDKKFVKKVNGLKMGDVDAIKAQTEEEKTNFAHAIFEINGKDHTFRGFCARFGVLYKQTLGDYARTLSLEKQKEDTRYPMFVREVRKEFAIDLFPEEFQMRASQPQKGATGQKVKQKLRVQPGRNKPDQRPTRDRYADIAKNLDRASKHPPRGLTRRNRKIANFIHNVPKLKKDAILEKAKEEGRLNEFEFQNEIEYAEVAKNDLKAVEELTKEEHKTRQVLAQFDNKWEEATGRPSLLNELDNQGIEESWQTSIASKWCKWKTTLDKTVAAVAKVDWIQLSKVLSSVLSVVGVLGIAYKAINWFSDTKTLKQDEPEYSLMGPPSVYASDGAFLYRPTSKQRNHGHRYKGGRNRDKRNPTTMMGPEQKIKMPDCTNLLRKCTVKFCNKSEYDENNVGWAVFVKDKHMLLNRHYVTGEQGMVFDNMFTFELQGVVFSSVFRREDVTILKDTNGALTDLILWRVDARSGNSVLSTPTLLKHFQREDEVCKDYWSSGKQPLVVFSTYADGHSMTPIAKAQATNSQNWKIKYADGQRVASDRALLYTGGFKRGDCGKLLVKGKIRGVHIAGKPGVLGTAQLVTKEMLEGAFSFQALMDVPVLDESSHEELPVGSYHGEFSDMRGLPEHGDFIPFASVPKPSVMSHITKLQATGMCEAGSHWAQKCKKVPAVLGVDDPRYTGTATVNSQFLADRMARYATRPPDLPITILSAAVAKLVVEVPPSDVPIRTWTVPEALNPRHIGSVLLPLKRSTGAGWGFKGAGKYEQIGFDEVSDTYYAKGQLIDKMKRVHELISQGKNPLFIFSEFPKDEVLTQAKIDAKCCRTVSASPLDFTVLSKQAFGAFLDSWQRVPYKWGHAVGLDVLSQDWDMMIKTMLRKGERGFDSDFKKFDSTMSKQFMVMFWKETDDWYKRHGMWDETSSLMRWIVIYNMVHSKHVLGRTILITMMGLPSGSLLTTAMNCFWARTLLLVGYALLAEESQDGRIVPLTFHGYDQNVKAFVLGDDNASAVSESISSWYNAKALGKVLSQYNIEITPAVKNTELSYQNKSVTKLEFLACTTRIANELPGWRYYPKIKDGALSKALCYVRAKEEFPVPVALDSNIYNSLLRIFCSGKERFDDFYSDVVGAYTRLYPESDVNFPTYKEVLLTHKVDDEFLEHEVYEQTTPPGELGLVLQSTMDVPVAHNMATGYDAPVSLESKAKSVGTQSIVGMPIVDTPQTLRLLLRRNYAGMAEEVNHVKAYLWANMGSIFGQHHASPDQYKTPLQKVASFFRVWSGPVHVTAYSDQAMSLSYLPGLNTTPHGTTGIFDVAISQNATTYGGAYNYAPKSVGFVNAKLPFTTVFHSLKIPHFADDVDDESNTGVLVVRTDDNQEKISVTFTTGDDFDMGVPYLCPRIRVSNFNMVPDTYPTTLQGISVSKSNYNVSDVQSSGVEMNPTSTMETTSDTKIDAKAGNDAPNVPTQLVSVLRQTSVYGSSAQRVNFDPSFTITNEMEKGDLSTANTKDAMPLDKVIRPMLKQVVSWTTSQAPGTVLASGLISPSDGLTGLTLGADSQCTALATVSSMYGFWRGPFTKGFSAVTSGVHVGRLGFACIYGQTSIPVGLDQLTSQRYAIFEVNAEKNTFVVEIPYVSTKRVLETYHGQNDSTKYSSGVWALFVVNTLRAPAAASTNVDVIISEGRADGLQFIAPFANNRTLSFGYVHGAAPLEKSAESKEPIEFQSDMGVPQSTGEEKVGVIMADNTVSNASAHDDVPNTSDVGIVQQPFLSYADMMERDQWIAEINWTTSQSGSPTTLLYSANVPFGLLVNTASRAVNSFRQVKTTAVITAKLTASAFHSGRLILMSLPMTTEAQMNAVMTNRGVYTYPNHVFLDAGASASVEFRIPFQFIKAYLDEHEDYAQFQVRVLTPLKVGTGGASSASVTLYVRFEQTELRVIKPL